jgi:MSHA biogenesis protein MshO
MKKFIFRENQQNGFTLVEMIIVIVITGIIGGMVAVFIRAPVQGYVDSGRRAAMTDVADTAVRRISRDLHLALSNSVRLAGGGLFLEFLPTAGAGRYRSAAAGGTGSCAAVAGNADGDALSFTAADTCFEVVGPLPPVVAGNQVVVYNLGIPGADVYAGNTLNTHNRRAVAAVGANNIRLVSANPLPLDACQFDPATGAARRCRFQVVTTPVTYACDLAAGTLTRYSGYPITAVQPTTVATLTGLPGVVTAVMANNVSGCGFTYNPNAIAQRTGVVTMALTITQQGESVSLYNANQVSNVP